MTASPFHLVRWLPPRKKQEPRRRQKLTSLQKEVTPETWTQKASGLLASILAGASAARTIKLGNMEYASELAEKLLKHASHLEALYQGINKSIAKKADGKVMKHHVQEAARLEDFGAKAQVWPARKVFHPSLQFYFRSSRKWVCFFKPILRSTHQYQKNRPLPEVPIAPTCTWQAAADAFLKPKKKGTTRKGKGGKTEEKEKSAQ